MKRKLFFSGLLLGLVITANAQDQSFSFESGEGFTLGALHNQDGWTAVSEDAGEATQTVVSDEKFTDGSRSLKIMGANGSHAGFMGASSPVFDNPGDKVRLTFDIYITAPTGGGSKSDIYIFGKAPMLGNITSSIIFGFNGKIQIYDSNGTGGVEYKNIMNYSTGVWYSLQLDYDFPADTIKYYLDGTLIHSGIVPGASEIQQLTFEHLNYSNDAYIDNIKLVESTLGTEDHLASKLTVYPNPVSDILNIDHPQNVEINAITVFDISGRVINIPVNDNGGIAQISLQGIPAGIYAVQIVTDEGTAIKRIIKK